MKNIFTKFISAFTIVALFVLLVGPSFANAATALTAASDTMTREAVSANSAHVIKFTAPSGVAATNTIVITFPSTFTTGSLAITDLQICHGANGTEHGTAVVTGGTACGATDETIASGNGASTIWGATVTGTTVVTLTAPSGTFTNAITTGQKVTITIAAAHMVNPSSAATPNVTITTTLDTLGTTLTVPIVDSDQVVVTATVNGSFSFDINTSPTGSSSSAPYSVALGTLSTGAVTVSNGTSTPWTIGITGGTNSSSGMSVTVANANGASGLVSVSKPADFIPSATATMAAGTANYGLCVATVGLSGWTRAGAYGTTCALNSGTNAVVGLTTTPAPILSSSGILSSAQAYIPVNAAISSSIPTHNDYQDTLTFIATGTF
jgi:hypothetical protein